MDEYEIIKNIHGSRIRANIRVTEDIAKMLVDRRGLTADCFRRALDEGLSMEDLAEITGWTVTDIALHMTIYPAN